MKTKFGLMLLPLLCAVSGAMAQGVEKEGAADQPEAVAAPAEPAAIPAKAKAPAKATSRGRMGTRSPTSLPTGDMRHCLDLKTRAEIIRCAETRRNK